LRTTVGRPLPFRTTGSTADDSSFDLPHGQIEGQALKFNHLREDLQPCPEKVF
jgi:hypothetical protein